MTTTETEKTAPKSSVATFSLVIGILSIVGSLFLPASGLLGIVALILGFMALREIKTQGFQGRGLAIGGIIAGLLGVGWYLFTVFVLAPAVARTFDTISSSLP